MRYILLLIGATSSLLAIEGGAGGAGGAGGVGGAAQGGAGAETSDGPWFTGPLLSPSSTVIGKNVINIEPYLYAFENFGAFNGHWHRIDVTSSATFNLQIPIQYGFSKRFQMHTNPNVLYNIQAGASAVVFADLPLGFDYQILFGGLDKWYPNIKLAITETFPTGKYQKLDPDKKGTDIGGFGSFTTSIGLCLGNLYKLNCEHYLSIRYGFFYSYQAPVHVRGFNAWGGGQGTCGKVYPGSFYTSYFGLEYSLTKNWVLALDALNVYSEKVRFKGQNGFLKPGVPATDKSPSSSQFSLAPAIEYNWNDSWGIIGGVWFTVAGRNATDFYSGVIAVNYTK